MNFLKETMYTDRTIPFECSTRGWYLDKATNIGKNKKNRGSVGRMNEQ